MASKPIQAMSNKRHLPAYAWATATLIIILVAGLWPFRAPMNDVKWLDQENGLRFGRHAFVLSSSPFATSDSGEDSSGTIELWLEPAQTTGRRTVLAFEGSGATGAPFLLQEIGDDLVVQRLNVDHDGTFRTAEFAIEGILREHKHVFVTITLGAGATSVYVDGVLVRSSQLLGRTIRSFTGKLVLAESPTSSDSWSGKILGLAIYDRELPQSRVSEHYEGWINNNRPTLTQEDRAAALYLFTEHQGSLVHSQLASASDLIIPLRYFVLRPAFLALPWQHYHGTWSYWQDVGINVAGFIPFGFYWVAYLATVRAIRNRIAATILLGFLTSLLIEVLQAYIPTRDSGMNDLITNTIGTGLGALLYRSRLCQAIIGNAAFLGIALLPKCRTKAGLVAAT
jgi:hypothetical protein